VVGEPVNLDGQQRPVGHAIVHDEVEDARFVT
jgi:hypothetical protein